MATAANIPDSETPNPCDVALLHISMATGVGVTCWWGVVRLDGRRVNLCTVPSNPEDRKEDSEKAERPREKKKFFFLQKIMSCIMVGYPWVEGMLNSKLVLSSNITFPPETVVLWCPDIFTSALVTV